MKLKFKITLLVLMLVNIFAFAQEKTLTGSVTSEGDLRSKSVEAIVARFASNKLDSRFLLTLLELPPKSCTRAAAEQHRIKPCGLVLFWRQ